MQIQILNGVYSDQRADFRTSYPINCVPVPLKTNISNGYLRIAEGITRLDHGDLPAGQSRGAINWNGIEYRVIGTKLLKIAQDGTYTTVGDVGPGGQVSMDYSFDRLAITSGGTLFYSDGTTLTQVTDADLGIALDMIWVDGYFMTTDGTSLVVTELNDPTAVDPLKYGSSEADPDPVVGLIKARNEVYAINRYTIEVFNNIGGENFPFRRVDGAIIPKGAVGTYAKCKIDGTFAFLGSARNEPCSIYLASAANPLKLATREIETLIQKYSEDELATVVMEYRETKVNQHIYVRLPNETVVYDFAASQALGIPVWFFLTSAVAGISPYRAKDFCYCYGQWRVGDTLESKLGYIDETVTTQYDNVIGYQFDTEIIYNGSKGVIVNQLEIVGLFGRAELGEDPCIFVSWTNDGEVWSDEVLLKLGKFGERQKRPQIRQGSRFANWRAYRIRGANRAVASFSRLEAELEPLAYG